MFSFCLRCLQLCCNLLWWLFFFIYLLAWRKFFDRTLRFQLFNFILKLFNFIVKLIFSEQSIESKDRNILIWKLMFLNFRHREISHLMNISEIFQMIFNSCLFVFSSLFFFMKRLTISLLFLNFVIHIFFEYAGVELNFFIYHLRSVSFKIMKIQILFGFFFNLFRIVLGKHA